MNQISVSTSILDPNKHFLSQFGGGRPPPSPPGLSANECTYQYIYSLLKYFKASAWWSAVDGDDIIGNF